MNDDDMWNEYLALSPWRSRKLRGWDDLGGGNWAALLARHPGFAVACDWRKLSGADWAELLAERPEFGNRCDRWREMDGTDWAWLLRKRPRFADRCDWSKLKGNDWRDLLSRRTEAATDRAGAVVADTVSAGRRTSDGPARIRAW